MKPGHIALLLLPVILLLLVRLISLGSGVGEGFAAGGSYGETNDRGTFILYYADWCPHCHAVLPIFKEFAKNGYVSVNDKRVKILLKEEKELEKGKDPEITGFPTMLYSDAAGKTVPYEGPRTAEGFMQFLKTQILS